MSIRKRIIIAVLIQAVLICLTGMFVYFSFSTVLSKLRAIEIIDDLNISLLEMRKSEKNYFLYQDPAALKDLVASGRQNYQSIQSAGSYITPSLGQKTYNDLLHNLKQYFEMAQTVIDTHRAPINFETQFRSLGHEITQLSELLLKRERKNVSNIIFSSTIELIAALGIIFIFQIIVWHYFFRLIIQELSKLENLIQMVSEGRIHEVAIKSIAPNNEIAIALKAIGDMAKELEKREAELLQSKRLASLGVLISGVAHELGNPLNNISLMSQTYLSLYDMLGDEEKKNFMGDVLNQTERIRKIIQNLLDFSRQKKQELLEYPPREIVERSIELVTNHLKLARVKLQKQIPEDLPAIFVDASQIEQVLVNLFINAIQAMPEGGVLSVDLDYDKNADQVVMKVKDTGTGIKEDILPYIFDPFFTTKDTKGTGLGLSVSYGIIKQHHGDIAVASEEGYGTSFIIKLPAHHAKEGESGGQEDHRH